MKKTQHLLQAEQIAKKRQNKGVSPVFVDANGRTLGRVATEVAYLIMGKDDPQWSPFIDATGHKVIVQNLQGIRVTGKKETDKKYYRHSEFFGGFKETNFFEEWQKSPEKLFVRTVSGMLPKNKLRKQLIKNIKFEK